MSIVPHGVGWASLTKILLLAGCEREPPWNQEGTSSPPAETAVTTAAPPPSSAKPTSEDATCLLNVPRTSNTKVDVTRLGLVCGASLGYRRATELREGTTSFGGTAVTFPLPLVEGRCYRVLLASDTELRAIAAVVSSRGTTVASQATENGVLALYPDRPFCAVADDAATIEVRSLEGSGQFSLEVWSR